MAITQHAQSQLTGRLGGLSHLLAPTCHPAALCDSLRAGSPCKDWLGGLQGKRFACIQAHSDDIPLMCGGLLAKLVAEGYKGWLIQTTNDVGTATVVCCALLLLLLPLSSWLRSTRVRVHGAHSAVHAAAGRASCPAAVTAARYIPLRPPPYWCRRRHC